MNNDIKNIWFDFHKECSTKNGGWGQLKKLLQQSLEFIEENGSYIILMRKNEISEKNVQKGVIRVNCFDSLDRTNVVQNNYCK